MGHAALNRDARVWLVVSMAACERAQFAWQPVARKIQDIIQNRKRKNRGTVVFTLDCLEGSRTVACSTHICATPRGRFLAIRGLIILRRAQRAGNFGRRRRKFGRFQGQDSLFHVKMGHNVVYGENQSWSTRRAERKYTLQLTFRQL